MRSTVRSLLVVTLAACLASPALAEWRATSWGWAPQASLNEPPPPIASERDLREWAIALDLDNEQRSALRALADGVSAEFDTAWLHAAEQRGALEETHPGRIHRRAWQLRSELHERYVSMRDQLVSDLELIVRPDQREAWEAFEDGRARRETLRRVRARGVGSFDLRATIDLMELPPARLAAVEPILDEHDDETARLVLRMRRELETVDREILSILDDRAAALDDGGERRAVRGEMLEALSPVAAKAAEACAKLHASKAAFARRLAEELPEAERDRLLASVRDAILDRNSFDGEDALRFADSMGAIAQSISVYESIGESPMGLATYGRVSRLVEPLTDEQRDAIGDIRERYEADVRAMRRKNGLIDPTTAPMGSVTLLGGLARVSLEDREARSQTDREAINAFFGELEGIEQRMKRELYDLLTVRQKILFRSMVSMD